MRSDLVSDWLSRSEWSTWQRDAMTGDASARRYERLHNTSGTSVILMDAPPETCGSQTRFVDIATHLRTLGLAAPRIHDWDESLGLMVLEDLGQADFATHLRSHPEDERTLYNHAVDALLILQSEPPPVGLTAMTPDVGTQMLDIAFEWAATDQSAELEAEIKAGVHDLLEQADPTPKVLSLRDFHAENLIWRPTEIGVARVGLLDFQDAFVTHQTYDLASLLRDARRDVDPALLDQMLRRLAQGTADVEAYQTAFHVMAIQRNLRILGIFHRLSRHDGKSGYLSLIPRVWSHIQTDLAAPCVRNLAPLINRAFAQPKATP